MKLIDADEIVKQFNERSEDNWNQQTITTWAGAYEDIAGEIDDKEECIVRCKDCKHGSIYCTEDTNGETLYECNIHGIAEIEVHRFDWFCADGEKQE